MKRNVQQTDLPCVIENLPPDVYKGGVFILWPQILCWLLSASQCYSYHLCSVHKIIRLNRHLGISIQIINYFEIKEILLEALNKRDEYMVQVMAQKALKSVQLVAYFNNFSPKSATRVITLPVIKCTELWLTQVHKSWRHGLRHLRVLSK